LVIALFYTSKIVWFDLYLGAGFLAILIAGNWAGIRSPVFYGIFGIGGLWVAFLLSGVHATVAGVLAAFTIPARTRINSREFLSMGRIYLNDFETADEPQSNVLSNSNQLRAVNQLADACEHAQTPLQRLEHSLHPFVHPFVTFIIMPIFALSNAGLAFNQEIGGALLNPVSLGILSGLFLGKQIGIFSFTWLVVKLKWAELPNRIRWAHIWGTAVLGGIGFTMSLFITDLAFKNPEFKDMAKIGIFAASLLSGLFGLIFLKRTLQKDAATEAKA
jgi:NhaA family Na+:H+ antiporter